MNLPKLNDQLFKTLCEQLEGESIVLLDVQGTVIGWNNSAERFYRLSENEIVGSHFTRLIKNLDADQALRQAQNKGSYRSIVELAPPVRDFIRAEITLKGLIDNGTLTGYAFHTRRLSATDVNTEGQLEKAAKELSAYKYALDEAAIVALTDQTGRITHVNDYFCRISGYSKAELIGQDHRLINSGYHEKEFIRQLWKTIANGKVWRGELCNRAKNGSIYWVATTIVPFLNDQGKPYQYAAIRYDITGLKLADEDLKRTNAEIGNLLESINDGFAALDKDLRYTYVNARICRMFGKKSEELLGKSIWDIFPEYIGSATAMAIENARKERIGVTNEEYYAPLNLWQENHIYPNETGLSIFISDISERKNVELQRLLLHNISGIFNQQEEMQVSLQSVLAEILQFSKASLAEIWLVSTNNDQLYLAAGSAENEKVAEVFNINTADLRTPQGNGLAGNTWQFGDIQFIDDLQNNAAFKRREAAEKAGLNSAICSPLRNNNDITGVVLLAFKEAAPPFLTRSLFIQLGSHLGAEIKRKQLKRELQQLFESVPDIICTIGLDRRFKQVNRSMCTILGYEEAFLLHATIDKLIHPDDLEESKSRMKSFQEGGIDNLYFENRYISRTGTIVHLAWTVNKSPEKGVLFAVGKEITEKKELEHLLEKASEMARIGSWEVNLTNNVVFWSDVANQIVEMPADHRPSRSDAEFFYSPETLKVVDAAMERVITVGEPFDLELELTTAKLRKIWVRVQGEGEFKHGSCHKVYGTIQDIDKRKRAELRASQFLEDRNEILESIGDGFFSVDNDWQITYWNRQAEVDFNVEKENLLNRNLWTIFPEVVNTVSFSELRTAMQTRVVRRYETFSKLIGRWFDVSVYPSPSGLSVFFKDIITRKHAEEQLVLQAQALVLSEQRYSDLFQISPMPKWVFDVNTLEFLEVNRAAVLHYGYTRDEFLKMNIRDIRPKDEVEKLETVVFDQSREKFQCQAGVFTHLKKSGERMEVEIISSLLNYNGRASRLVLAMDVTERNRHLDEIQQQNQRLRDISWMQSHVIRAPLSRLMGLINLLNETAPVEPGTLAEITRYIDISAQELDKVIHNIVKNADMNSLS